MGTIVRLTSGQAGGLDCLENGLYYQHHTGYYLRIVPDSPYGEYEVMYKPYYPPAPSPDIKWTVKTAANTTPLYDEIMKLYNEPYKYLGEFPIQTKEKEMEIGGEKCHLCGANTFSFAHSTTNTKKHEKYIVHRIYECGTQLFREGCNCHGRKNQHVDVGEDCINV